MSSKYLGERFDIHGGGMDLQFPHHESEIAQSTIAHGCAPVNYWMHNNMITINGKKMGKSYNNVIKLTELFTGGHPELTQAYHPMVVRFNILQSHYRSTLDFSNEGLQASERAFKRLWEAYETLKTLSVGDNNSAADDQLDAQLQQWCLECADFMNDDFNTAKVLANFFEMAPVINGINGGQIAPNSITASTLELMKATFKTYLEDILGLQPLKIANDDKIDALMQLIIDIRRQARTRKDFETSDRIRDMLASAGIQLKDGKGGEMTYSID